MRSELKLTRGLPVLAAAGFLLLLVASGIFITMPAGATDQVSCATQPAAAYPDILDPPWFLQYVDSGYTITEDFAYFDGYIYVLQVKRIIVIDVRDPAAPRAINRVPAPHRGDLVVHEDELHLLEDDQWSVFDLSNPACPQLAPGYPKILGGVYSDSRLAVSPSGLLVVSDVNSTKVFDPQSPQFPSALDSIDLLAMGYINHVYLVNENYAYCQKAIVDISDPNNLAVVSELPKFRSIAVENGLAFLYTADENDARFELYDVSDPSQATLLDTFELTVELSTSEAGPLDILNGRAYAQAGFESLFIAELSVDNGIEVTSVTDLGTRNAWLRAESGKLYGFGREDGYANAVRIFDVQDPAQPQHLGTHPIDGTPLQGDLVNKGYIYGKGDYNGIAVIDVRNPHFVHGAGIVSFPARQVDFFYLFGQYIYGSYETGTESTYALFDVSSPVQPALLDRLSGYTSFDKVALSDAGDLLVAGPVLEGGADDFRLDIIGIASDDTLVRRSELPLTIGDPDPGHPSNLYLLSSGQRAYFLRGEVLTIIDIADASTPQVLGQHVFTGGQIVDAQVEGTKLYLAGLAGGISIFDCADPQNVSLVSQTQFSLNHFGSTAYHTVGSIELLGAELYYATTAQYGHTGGVLDISTPEGPQIIAEGPPQWEFFEYGSYRFETDWHAISFDGRGPHSVLRDTRIPLGTLETDPTALQFPVIESTETIDAAVVGAIAGAEIFAEVTEGKEFFEVVAGEYLVESGTISVRALGNDSTEAREGTVTIYAPEAENAPLDIPIGQDGLAPAELSVSPGALAADAAGGTLAVAVENAGDIAMPWSAALDPPVAWLEITSGAPGEDDGEIALACAANPTTAERVATLVVTAPGAANSPVEITITQAGLAPAQLVLLPEQHEASAAAGTVELAIANPGDMPLNWTAQVFGGVWLRITSGTSGEDNGVIALEYDANPNPNQRTSTVQISANGGELSALAVIRQAGAADPADINGSGSVDAVDVQMIINAVLFGMTDPQYDTTGDNQINAADVQSVINAALG